MGKARRTSLELIVAGYGSSFWGRVDKEAEWSNEKLKLYRRPFVDPHLDDWLRKRQLMIENHERACTKRPREERISQPPERKKRRPNNGTCSTLAELAPSLL